MRHPYGSPYSICAALLTAACGLLTFAGHAQSSAGRTWLDARQSGPGVQAQSSWVDARGTTYVVGFVTDETALPGLPLIAAGEQVSLLAKAAPDGTWRWIRTARPTTPFPNSYVGFDRVVGDGHGGVYVTGEFRGTVEFSSTLILTSTPNASLPDGVVARYDTAGTLLWVRQLARPNMTNVDTRVSLAVDSTGNATIAFSLQDTTIFGGFRVLATGRGREVVVARLNRQGTVQWVAQSTGSADEDPTGVGVDAAGNVYVTGALSSARGGVNTDSVAQFGAAQLHVLPVSVGSSIPLIPYELFVARLNGQGQWQWATKSSWGDGGGRDIAVGPGGEAYVLGGGSWSSAYGSLARLGAAGQWEWVRGLTQEYTGGAANGAMMNLRLALSPGGHPCLLGVVGAVTKLDSVIVLADTLRPATPHTYHIGAMQLDPAGHLEWALMGRGAGYISYSLAMAGGGADAGGRTTFVGTVLDSLTLGPMVLTNPASAALVYSLFIAHIGIASPTGLSSALAAGEARLYPNPVRRGHALTLELPVAWAGARVEVLNALGQVVGTGAARRGRTAVPTAGLPAGLYSVRVLSGGQHLTRRVVVE